MDIYSLSIIYSRWNRAKITLAQRMDRVKQKKASYLKKLQEEDDE